MAESPNVWKRFWSHFDWLDSIDVVLYGGLGLALLGYAVYSIGSTLLSADQIPALGTFMVVVALTLGCFVRDLWRRELSPLSKGFAGAWGLCVALVILVELIASFS